MANLESYGIKLRSSRAGGHKVTCPNCSHLRKNKKDPCLSVTIESDGHAVWNCHHCTWSGSTKQKGDYFKAQPVKYIAPPLEKEFKQTKKMYDWLEDRRISRATAVKFLIHGRDRLFGKQRKECIVFPYLIDGKPVNYKYRSYDKEFQQEKDATPTLFNIDSVKEYWKSNPKEIIFVEGEMDVLAMWEAGFRNVVSFPTGAPQQVANNPDDRRFAAVKQHDFLSEATKVILAFDADGPGKNMQTELMFRFGPDRCYTVDWGVELYEGQKMKDPNEILMELGKEDGIKQIKLCVDTAKPCPIQGLYRVEEFRSLVDDLYEGNIIKPLDVGFPLYFDQLYKVLPGTFHAVTGVPNHGKSNFLDQMAIMLAEKFGWRFAVFSPENRTDMHIKKLIEKYVQMPFDSGALPRMEKNIMWDGFDFVNDHFYFLKTGEIVPSIDWLLEKIKSAHYRYGINGFILDPYNEIDASREAGKREDEHIRDIIIKTKRVCQHHNLVAWVVAHPHKRDSTERIKSLYEISGGAHWYNSSDSGLSVHRDFESGITTVDVLKVRDQPTYGQIGHCTFRYDIANRRYHEDHATYSSIDDNEPFEED